MKRLIFLHLWIILTIACYIDDTIDEAPEYVQENYVTIYEVYSKQFVDQSFETEKNLIEAYKQIGYDIKALNTSNIVTIRDTNDEILSQCETILPLYSYHVVLPVHSAENRFWQHLDNALEVGKPSDEKSMIHIRLFGYCVQIKNDCGATIPVYEFYSDEKHDTFYSLAKDEPDNTYKLKRILGYFWHL